MALALLIALVRSTAWPDEPAAEIQAALEWQKRLDLFDIMCQDCGGLGVVADLANRWYDGEDMVYGGKRCPACDGLGSPRG